MIVICVMPVWLNVNVALPLDDVLLLLAVPVTLLMPSKTTSVPAVIVTEDGLIVAPLFPVTMI